MTFRTRFAPSPTGPLHLGHAYSALLAYDMACAAEGTFLLRIEDIDQSRARDVWEQQIYDDLTWLGLSWPQPVLRQSDRLPIYRQALDAMDRLGLLYPCTCTRRDIEQAASAPQEGVTPAFGPDGLIYPGTCRDRPPSNPQTGQVALRLNMERALALLSTPPQFTETGSGTPVLHALDAGTAVEQIGDIVLARRDFATSYHLSVVVDDAAQNITHVVRGKDLFEATFIHVLLQKLLGLETPVYHHHTLIRDAQGKRLAKRDDARAIAKYRAEGYSPDGIRDMIGLGRQVSG